MFSTGTNLTFVLISMLLTIGKEKSNNSFIQMQQHQHVGIDKQSINREIMGLKSILFNSGMYQNQGYWKNMVAGKG